MAKKIVILYSGGLDSFILERYAQVNYPSSVIKCIYYAHNAEAEKQEISKLPSHVEIRHLDWLNETTKPLAKSTDPIMGAAYIPGRNLVFCTLAASQELPDEIWLGTNWDEVHPRATDKNEKFRVETSKLISYVLSPFHEYVNIRFPLVENQWTKVESVQWALDNKITKEEIVNTISCWHPVGNMPCGVCKQCFRRNLVFLINGIDAVYAADPLTSEKGRAILSTYIDMYNDSDYQLDRDESNVISMIKRSIPNFDQDTQGYIMKKYPHFRGLEKK